MCRKSSFLIGLFFILVIAANAQTTAFNFQGRLNDGANPANGVYEMQFALFDLAAAGNQIGATVTNTNVQVSAGAFAVSLDFGTNAFPGADRFLEIRIRPAGNPNPYTVLSPRQQVLSVPQSIVSLTANNALNLGGVPANEYVTAANGGASFIQNSNTLQTSANFRIDGVGSADIFNVVSEFRMRDGTILRSPNNNSLFVGFSSGLANTGAANSFFGTFAGQTNTTGESNSFFGAESGKNNSDASSNSFFGWQAGFRNSNQSNNTFVGAGAGRDNGLNDATVLALNNTFVGSQAGIFNRNGGNNTFVGSAAGQSNIAGKLNAFFGTAAGQNNVVGDSNSFFGYSAGFRNSNQNNNTFVGYSAGFGNGDGAVGIQATNNTFVGSGAGQNNTIGFSNAFFGFRAGFSNVSGSSVTTIGNQADVASNNLTYATAIGADSIVSANNTIALGRSSGDDKVVIYGLGSSGSTQLCRNALNQIATCSSSLRYKTNIEAFSAGLSIVRQLRPITFDWKTGGPKDVGFGAEDVARIDPRLAIYNDKGEIEGVKYDRLSVVFVNAIKEQQEQIEKLQQEIDLLKRIVCLQNPELKLCGSK